MEIQFNQIYKKAKLLNNKNNLFEMMRNFVFLLHKVLEIKPKIISFNLKNYPIPLLYDNLPIGYFLSVKDRKSVV